MGSVCGGEEENKDTEMGMSQQEKSPEKNHDKEEDSKAEKEEVKKPEPKPEPKPDNTPYMAMKTGANRKAWECFEKDFHKPTSAEKRGAKLSSVEKAKNGDMYLGTVDAKGKYEGWGVLMSAKTGEIYQGEFAKGKANGPGILFVGDRSKAAAGTKVTATFKGGKVAKGDGKIEFPNGDVWTGVVANGLPNGAGSLVCKNGAKYKGMMKNGFKNDKRAELIDEKGNSYVGGFKNDVKNGKGKSQLKGG
jgi:hypothetical protein